MATDHAKENFFNTIQKPFPNLIDGKINTEQFLDASRGVVTLVEKLGKLFAPVKYDMNQNVEKITKKYQSDVSKNVTLQDLVLAEQAEGANLATDALLWFTRALHFMETFLDLILANISDNSCESLKGELTAAYTTSVKRYHGWMSQQLFLLLCRMCPTRSQFFTSLGGSCDAESFNADLEAFLRTLRVNRMEIHRFYAAHKLDNDTVV